jgi:4-hydroxy-3-polyprenylbenzoate decarboxylase
MPRETPLSLPAIENMRLARLAGAILLPPMVAYYPQPRTVEEITDFFVGKVLDLLRLDHELYRRWGV